MRHGATFAVLALFLSFVVSGCTGSTEEEFVTFESAKFRRNAAHEAFIGTVGLARDEAVMRYEVKYMPYWKVLVLRNTTTEDSKLKRELRSQLGYRFDALPPRPGNGEQPADGSVHLYLLRIADIQSMVEGLNAPENERYRDLMSGDPNYRIVTSVIIAFEEQPDSALRQASALRFELNSDRSGHAYIDVKKDDENVARLTMSDGTVVAYEYSRLCWKDEADTGEAGPWVGDIMLDRAVGGGDEYECPKGLKTKL